MTITRFSFPTTIHFGAGARKLVARHLLDAGVKRPLIVSDRALAALPVMAELMAFKLHRADAVIGFGGGAALDVAKVVGLMAVHDGDVLDYVWDQPGVKPIVNPLPYFVALPTTAGTGSEVGRSSVVAQNDTHIKRTVFSVHLLARAVFADPELTFALPPAITAATGMDALTHNIESYLSPAYHPLCDGIALEGLRIGARALAKAVHEPSDLAARSDMMMSSMMGAIAFQKDLGAVHACAHALGAVADLHHGLANALMIEPVLRFNLEAVPHRFAELAHAVGVADGAAFIDWLSQLKADIGIAPGLASRGVRREQFERLVQIASADICGQTNPRPCSPADFDRFFAQAL